MPGIKEEDKKRHNNRHDGGIYVLECRVDFV